MHFSDCPTPDAAAPTNPSAFEPAPLKLEELTDRCLGSIALVERLLASFEQRFPLQMSGIVQRFEAGDMPRLALEAHELKGAAANMSAPTLRAMLEQLEHAARAGQVASITGYLDQLQLEWQRFCRFRSAGTPAPLAQGQPSQTLRSTASPSSEDKPCGY